MRPSPDPDKKRLPIKLDSTFSGEFMSVPLNATNRRANQLAKNSASDNARRRGVDRRTFMVSACGAASTLLALNAANAASDRFEWLQIAFDDLTPPEINLQQSWNALGMDDQGRIYIGFTSNRNKWREDVAVFRYDPLSGQREFLGTFVETAASADNLGDGESIPKGHTRIIYADGKMYMGSQGFHDFKDEIDNLPIYRGSHIFSYEISSGAWQDLSADLPNGVVTEHEGIVAMSILRDDHLLVALTHPHSNIVLFNYQTNKIVRAVPGIPWKRGNPLSREVIVAPTGNIYTFRGTEDPAHRDESNPVWVYNIHSGQMKRTSFTMTNGFWIGQAQTRDGSKIYVSTVNGQLYEFDVATETFKNLGYMLPEEDYEGGRRIIFQYGITLSPDEKTLFFIPSLIDNPKGSGELYFYNIATGEVKFVQQLPPGIYTSGNAHDQNNIYFAHFGTEKNLWQGDVRLMIIQVPSH